MTLPYQSLTSVGDDGIIAASRGGSIFTFAANGALSSSWHHPSLRGSLNKSANGSADKSNETTLIASNTDASTPPSKRRKIDPKETTEVEPVEAPGEASQDANGEVKPNGSQKPKRGKSKPSDMNIQEQAFVILLQSTPSGSHVIAVTGSDKSIWVLEHDGKGQLTEISQRQMPKRPCDIALTSDGKTLLVADKFGDVYAVPLLEAAKPAIEIDGNATLSGASTPRSSTSAPKAQGANSLTVHTLRNLKALEDQRRQRESAQAGDATAAAAKDAPTFEHELLLGHVSMLTSIAAVAAAPGARPYILTADRDEHIRVSRGIPQAHVIENYCLGHTSFINALCLPRPDTLVSAGGDDELFVWDWRAGRLSGKADLLSHARAVAPGTSKVAVSKMLAGSHGGSVFAICERIPAAFVFQLTDAGLQFVQTLALPGNPLDLALIPRSDGPSRLVVGVDREEAAEATLVAFQSQDGGSWAQASEAMFQDTDTSGQNVPSRSELEKILYPVENLRKTDFSWGEGNGEGTPAQESETVDSVLAPEGS